MFLIVSGLIQNFTVKGAPGKPLPSEEPFLANWNPSFHYCMDALGFSSPVHIYILTHSSYMLYPPHPRIEPL